MVDEIEKGDSQKFWPLCMEMTLESTSQHYTIGKEIKPDITKLPGWEIADQSTRAKILDCAKKYIYDQKTNSIKWLGKNILYRPDFAGYKAFSLIYKKAYPYLLTIPSCVWKVWAPVILGYPFIDKSDDIEIQEDLICFAYTNAPHQIIDTLMQLLKKEDEEQHGLYIIRRLKKAWDEQLLQVLFEWSQNNQIGPDSLENVFDVLIVHNHLEATEYAKSLLSDTFKLSRNKQYAIVAAVALFKHAADLGWSEVSKILVENSILGKEIVKKIAQALNRNEYRLLKKLNETELTDLYIWMSGQFPHDQDPNRQGGSGVGLQEHIRDFRESILATLKNKGTIKACLEIERISIEYPELDWLKWTIQDARFIARQKCWQPLPPSQVIELSANQRNRLIRNGIQLIDILTESLNRLEKKLQGETPAAEFLWDEPKNGLSKPRNENTFSNFVKRHLEEDITGRGIIVNREVEIRRGKGAGIGNRTDIHVDAVRRLPNTQFHDVVSVIIEVKGCWNSDLETDMKTQLVDCYLKDNRCKYGIYLIGWFKCCLWDNTDYRKNETPTYDIEVAREKFNKQALKLSEGGNSISAVVINAAWSW